MSTDQPASATPEPKPDVVTKLEKPSSAATSATTPTAKPGASWKKPIIIVAVIGALIIVIPKIIHALQTVETDDAYVNSYVTFVAPRVTGQVQKVLVEDNNRVQNGDVLVQLDPEPYEVQVAIKQAAVNLAQSNLVVADASVRSQVAQARSNRFKLMRAIEDVDNQVALIRARAATVDQAKATLTLAQSEYDRSKKLYAGKVSSAEELDQKREALDVAQAQSTQALESVYQARVALGLPAQPPQGGSLTEVPADIDQTFSSVRQALADLIQSASQLGVIGSSFDLTPKQTIEEFYKRDPSGNIDKIYAAIIKDAPEVKKAHASLEQAERDLDDAKLSLRYCTIRSEIDGVVTRRNVNPGNHVQAGQSLMAVRSLKDIWVDANFKETQLRDLRIGQQVKLTTDLYGGHEEFEGRISGFTMGTGSTLALLPAQNATGNFVKVVQRLPVRIDLVNYDPDKVTLFVGLSVTPEVDIRTEPEGPNAGKFLQAPIMQPGESPAPAGK
ncbi:MAG: HlyD family secretion protein [Chthoniobacteraceae bacterium]